MKRSTKYWHFCYPLNDANRHFADVIVRGYTVHNTYDDEHGYTTEVTSMEINGSDATALIQGKLHEDYLNILDAAEQHGPSLFQNEPVKTH